MQQTSSLRKLGVPATETFAEFMERDRARLKHELEKMRLQRGRIDDEIYKITRELEAITAYEAAKTGKPTPAARAPREHSTVSRETVVDLVKRHDGGLGRADLLERTGAKGDKKAESRVSQLLTVLVKAGMLSRQDGRYHPAAA